jgi:putative ABC transport system permease protein
MSVLKNSKEGMKSLRSNKLRTFLMMLGVIIGIATFTTVIAIGQGGKSRVMKSMNKMWGAMPIAITPGGKDVSPHADILSAPATLTKEDADAIIREVLNVKDVCLVQIKSGVPVSYKGKNTTVLDLMGVTPNFETIRTTKVISGDFISEEDMVSLNRVCLIGQTIVKELFGDKDPIDEIVRIENVNFVVKGMIEPKGAAPGGVRDLDNRILIPQTTFARRMYNVNHLSQIVVLLVDTRKIEKTGDDIATFLRRRHNISSEKFDDFTIRLPSTMAQMSTKTSQTLTIFLVIISLISLAVGGIVIMNIMLISVSERIKEIGIRRALGAKKRDILSQFLFEAGWITFIAGLVGVVLGVVIATSITLIAQIPSTITIGAIILAFIFSVLVGIVFGLQPARKAAGLNPIEALRTE